MLKVVYPGTFDPFTRGHEDLVRRAARLFDRVVVGVADSEAKRPFFTTDERVAMAREVLAPYLPTSRSRAFSSLLMDFVHAQGARVILRGLRAVSDFEYEFQMAGMNRNLYPGGRNAVPDARRSSTCSSRRRSCARSRGSAATSRSSSTRGRTRGCGEGADVRGARQRRHAPDRSARRSPMALMITDECINCDVCEPECPNERDLAGPGDLRDRPRRSAPSASATSTRRSASRSARSTAFPVNPDHVEIEGRAAAQVRGADGGDRDARREGGLTARAGAAQPFAAQRQRVRRSMIAIVDRGDARGPARRSARRAPRPAARARRCAPRARRWRGGCA